MESIIARMPVKVNIHDLSWTLLGGFTSTLYVLRGKDFQDDQLDCCYAILGRGWRSCDPNNTAAGVMIKTAGVGMEYVDTGKGL